ncbi:nucleotidyltransferase family protein [candidate division WOR-3 bacterium]|nr:nucleotidyltransferase family protein [candidate division WOR-3 bacterium]
MLSIKEYKRVNIILQRNGIDTVLIKSIFSFPYYSDNLDVLVRRNDIKKAKNILREEGYIELKNVEEPEKFLFRKFNGGKTVLPIHIHTVVGWGVPFLDNDFVWRDLRCSMDCPECYIPSKEASFLITIAHEFYEDKFIKRESIDGLKKLIKEGINWDDIIKQSKTRGWSDGFYLIMALLSDFWKRFGKSVEIPSEILQEKWGLIAQKKIKSITRKMTEKGIKIPFFYSKWLYYKKVLQDKRKPLHTKIFNVLTTLLWTIELKVKQYFKYNSQPGFLIAISGIDGSGKTTQAEMFINALKECEIRTKYIWMRYGSSSFVNKLIKFGKLIMRKKERAKPDSKIEERKAYLGSQIGKVLWEITTVIELYFYSLKIRWFLFWGYFVVSDRYILDAISEMAFYIKEVNNYAKILSFVFPRPHISFYLSLSLNDFLNRNSDEKELLQNPENAEKLISLYNFWSKKLKVKDINGTEDKSKINNKILIETLQGHYSNFWTLYRWLLFSTSNRLNRV